MSLQLLSWAKLLAQGHTSDVELWLEFRAEVLFYSLLVAKLFRS